MPSFHHLFIFHTLIATSVALAADCDWSPLGTGAGPAAYGCAALDDGSVVFGGSLNGIDGQFVNRIAIWDGSAWSQPGNGVNGFVRSIVALSGGGFIAGGHFTRAGGMNAGLIARWDGTQWHAFGDGLDAGSCRAILSTGDGKVIAAGSFLQADNQPAWGIAEWDGEAWSKLGNNTLGGGVSGWFTPEPSPTMVLDLIEMPTGEIIACGNFTGVDGVPMRGIASWDGVQWNPLGSGVNNVPRAMTLLPSGDLLVAGNFSEAGGVDCYGLAIWDGFTWSAVGNGLNGTNGSSYWDLETTSNGKVILSGFFHMVDSVPANNIAIYDPGSDEWSPLGTGMIPAIQTTVWDATVAADGTIYAGGQFSSAGGNSDAWNVASYDCLSTCDADLNNDGLLNFLDVSAFLSAFSVMDSAADFVVDGQFNFLDVSAFLGAYSAGCP